jgi:hypothetical protein
MTVIKSLEKIYLLKNVGIGDIPFVHSKLDFLRLGFPLGIFIIDVSQQIDASAIKLRQKLVIIFF